ncbi:MAG: hypothetical protein ACRDT2_03830 [Natronosporangium sp.]
MNNTNDLRRVPSLAREATSAGVADITGRKERISERVHQVASDPRRDTPMPPGVVSCWQIMTGLAIDNRADAIDYLFHSGPRPRLSTGELAALLDAFPLLPTTPRASTPPTRSPEQGQ